MKKIFLACSIILFSHLSSIASGNKYLELSLSEMSFENGKVERYFQVFTDDHERFITDLQKLLHAPTIKESPGIFSWNNLEIEGIGKGLTIEVQDGLLESDKANKTACWTTFVNNESKTARLNRMSENDARMMKIYVKDAKGNDLLGDYDKMQFIKQHLESKLL